MVIGRERPREHPKDTSEGVTWLRSLRVLHNLRLCMHTPKRTPKGVKWPSVTSGSHVTTTKKKAGEKAGHAQNLLPVRAPSEQGLFRSRDWRHFRSKGHIKADIAQLPVAHAYNILPDTWLTSLPVMWLTSLPVTSLRSLPVTWLPVAPPQIRLCPYPYTTYRGSYMMPVNQSKHSFGFYSYS
jgi:hypothetical protein